MKRKLIFCAAFAVTALINILPVVIFKEKAAVSQYSYVSVIVMAIAIAYAISCYIFRHKGNFLPFYESRHVSIFSYNKDYTFTEEYAKKFYWQFFVFCLSIPFYIPCIFFASKDIHMLWGLFVFSVPQIVYITYGACGIVKKFKGIQSDKRRQEQERIEQEKREEMGRFK